MTYGRDLLGPAPTLLPGNEAAEDLLAQGQDGSDVAARHPEFSLAWAILAEAALEQNAPVTAYAYARTGYHRGLDQLRRNGWRGFGPVPWEHEPNQGFLRAVGALAKAAKAIGEEPEYQRCLELLLDSDPRAASELGLG
ncbi:DUF3151 domain-containing protein [Segniliparus rugosus]|uniref:DUF3151 domain-containing protein n=1 Tax=Segniliparus rugosus (strain ATCC BAA-974 / DSM 45345 / CCUG 50838 / CIP 108380 / JCM 13579 / CDC 945) TaxID=679197 RepID=E5XPH8_SEGRC|nr:DUF3151 domain-containing protein [Segniliparus rugosus]EFV13741.2 hypothetical protein HMPREF9336_01400 [Segniliparus rugosus ATCC BAA-974]